MKYFGLIDCNSFFASCERIFRPDLNGKPIVVLSNNDGCVIARSAEARQLGVKMCAPFYQIKNYLAQENVAVFSSNYALYADISKRVMAIIASYAPNIEVYSIDEAFIELSGLNDAERMQMSTTLKQQIGQQIGINVCIGMAPTKTLAKLANHAAKKYPVTKGVVDIWETHRQHKLLKITDVSEIWGVGRKLTKHLYQENIRTAYDLSQANLTIMQRKYSVNIAKTIQELNGIPCDELNVLDIPQKQLIYSRSFSKVVTQFDMMRQVISTYAENAAERLRKENLRTKSMTIYISSNRFHYDYRFMNHTHDFEYFTNDSREIVSAALSLLPKVWEENQRYIKAGIILSNFEASTNSQLDLFAETQSKKSLVLMAKIDEINRKHGHVMKLAINGDDARWAMRRNMLSPSYTVKWCDIPKVN